jgi:hypothetical protein
VIRFQTVLARRLKGVSVVSVLNTSGAEHSVAN